LWKWGTEELRKEGTWRSGDVEKGGRVVEHGALVVYFCGKALG
jgi:hypothetical protein